ncbi:MAG: sulfite exporter TauE/SafE family protein, partial [Planctomycetia bacterium]|nr:sulfite exporter TauE/SafE family protein [Planctomycetia bacterium]
MVRLLLPLALALVACLYAAVGHAGATGYIAVMGLFGIAPQTIRPTALILNAVVGVIATVQFARAGHLRHQLLLPLTVTSVPAAAIGGWLQLPTAAFEGLVGTMLLFSAA